MYSYFNRITWLNFKATFALKIEEKNHKQKQQQQQKQVEMKNDT